MSAYNPPSQNNAIFDSSDFGSTSTSLTQDDADRRYLRFPTAQGAEFLQDITVNGNAVLNANTTIGAAGKIIFNDTTQQTSAYTGAGQYSGSYVNTNLTLDANGKITAISSGSGGAGTVAAQVTIANNNSNADFYPTFVSDTGDQAVYIDKTTTPMKFNPFLETLTVTNLAGTATNAQNVAITTGSGTTNYLTFVDATTGNKAALVDADLTYNASTNTLTVPNLAGTAANASNIAITTGSGTTNYLTFVDATTGNKAALVDADLTYNASTNTLTVPNLAGNSSSTSTTAITTGTGATNYLTFVDATSGNKAQLVNSNLTYDASSGTLTCPNLNSTVSNATTTTIATGTGTTNYVTFVDALSGNKQELVNSNLTYDASNNIMSTNISGGTNKIKPSSTSVDLDFYPLFMPLSLSYAQVYTESVASEFSYNPGTNTLSIGNTKFTDNTIQSSAYTGGTPGSYTNPNITIDSNGKISAISSNTQSSSIAAKSSGASGPTNPSGEILVKFPTFTQDTANPNDYFVEFDCTFTLNMSASTAPGSTLMACTGRVILFPNRFTSTMGSPSNPYMRYNNSFYAGGSYAIRAPGYTNAGDFPHGLPCYSKNFVGDSATVTMGAPLASQAYSLFQLVYFYGRFNATTNKYEFSWRFWNPENFTFPNKFFGMSMKLVDGNFPNMDQIVLESLVY